MIEYGYKKNYLSNDGLTKSILIINGYIGKNKEIQNGISIREI